jgi:peptidoglycan/xylan/chitin deacetylase (PgdA/CDA1 family)
VTQPLRALRRTCQVLLCAAAIAGGAWLAREWQGRSETVPAIPVAAAATIAHRSEEAPREPEEEALREPEAEQIAPAPPARTSFGEHVREGMVMTGATPHRLILFTFDDGPDLRYTPRLLDRLDRFGVKAVFFLTASRFSGDGPWQLQNRELAREILRRGHFVGNHTVDHLQLPLLEDAEIVAQVEGADAVFERVLGSRSWLMRPPGGARSSRVDAMLAERGYTQVLWNLGSGDFQVRDAEEVFHIWRRVLARRERENGERGGIVLLHDTHEWSVEAFPMIVSHLRDRNCALLERGEELYDIVDDPRLFYSARDPGQPGAAAPPASPPAELLAERQARLREETAQRCTRVAQR